MSLCGNQIWRPMPSTRHCPCRLHLMVWRLIFTQCGYYPAMTARLGRAVANGSAAPIANACRRDTPAAKAFCNDEDLCGNNCIRSARVGVICVFRSARRGVSEDAAATVSRVTDTTMRTVWLAWHCMFTQHRRCHRRELDPKVRVLDALSPRFSSYSDTIHLRPY